QMAWLDVQSGGRKEDPKFQASLAIQKNAVLKISKQCLPNKRKALGSVPSSEKKKKEKKKFQNSRQGTVRKCEAVEEHG
ncbi:hypothetical protein OFC05_31655, partial [Escherichia coli]|nr:hypothetical protein [Escherichia coli]